MALREYTEFAEPLRFPINGKVYTAPEVTIELGIRLNGIADGTADQDMPMLELYKLLLGPVWDEMIADGVALNAASRAGMTVMNDFLYGREYAETIWETGLDPKAAAALTAARSGNRASRRSTSTGKARRTRSQASTSGTTSPQA